MFTRLVMDEQMDGTNRWTDDDDDDDDVVCHVYGVLCICHMCVWQYCYG